MFKSIFQRLFWTISAIIFLVVIMISTSMFGLLNSYVLNEKFKSAKKASVSIEYLTTALTIEYPDPRYRDIYDSTLSSWSMMMEADITVINRNGVSFASTNYTNKIPDEFVDKVLNGGILRCYTSPNNSKGARIYVIGIPIRYQNTVIGGIFYYYPHGIMRGTVMEYSYMLLMSLLFSMAIALCFVYFESKRISRPLKEINSAVLEIASGKFDKRVAVSTTDEIGQLASSFNYMADSLTQLEAMRSNFVSDISHELRTPMTSISGFIEGILDGTIPDEKKSEYLKIALEESRRLTRLTNEMFEMSKMTSPGYKLIIKEFDIAEMTRRCIISAEKNIEDKHLELDIWFENDSINVLADQDAIKRVIINLLDNAIKFSKDGQCIKIRIFEKNKHINFEISNIGIGISPEDQKHIFERFYKSDKSRGRDKTGAGLGLSFVNNILSLHSQKIWVSSTPYGVSDNLMKTTFTFTLERA
ncbi:MAG: HAMP domain-containing sensor histidine kinase [Firmicutes bacterium]|nr:HAMP domain-containing sensor histidine kinase [Bacillota bacterium]